ncbi:cytochrome C nitrite reductase [Novosphingobium soli]|uniref:Cytochrome C nitrite reductase n=1 Tax=Novosphingobium soli TaxID=574956 RepID=A0ABV6D0W8_9SPHN
MTLRALSRPGFLAFPASVALPACLVLAACGGPAPTPQETAEARPSAMSGALRSQTITLPDDTLTFAAAGGDAVLDQHCIACHSTTMVLYQPPLKREQWAATVKKMREAYGAPITPDQDAAVVDALLKLRPAA